ncbi:hypothetical protein D4S03_12275 [bacterium]|nr:MAG: hypothetical protein D4S03_12275 [bacterium]
MPNSSNHACLLLTAVGIEIGRIVYARGEVGKVADGGSALDATLFSSINEVREIAEQWLEEYNMHPAARRNPGFVVLSLRSITYLIFPLSNGTKFGMLTHPILEIGVFPNILRQRP